MYGVKPEDLQWLQPISGCSLVKIGVGQFQLDFCFDLEFPLSVEGRCELLDSSGGLVDVWDGGGRSQDFRFLDLLGKKALAVAIDTPRSFVVTFENEWKLRIMDNSDEYESFSFNGLFV